MLQVLLLSWQNVLPGTTPILPDTKVRAPMRGLDDYVPPARRPLLTPRQLATMPPPERMLLLEYRLFYSVHQLQVCVHGAGLVGGQPQQDTAKSVYEHVAGVAAAASCQGMLI